MAILFLLAKQDQNKLIVQRVAVVLGERHQAKVVVKSGLKAGDQVVVSGQLKLSDGIQVEPTVNTLEHSQSSSIKPKV